MSSYPSLYREPSGSAPADPSPKYYVVWTVYSEIKYAKFNAVLKQAQFDSKEEAEKYYIDLKCESAIIVYGHIAQPKIVETVLRTIQY